MTKTNPATVTQLATRIKSWSRELGFSALGITDIALEHAEARLQEWLDAGFDGEMGYMRKHGRRRTRPAELVAGTARVLCVRMDYRTESANATEAVLRAPEKAYIARYALGRDYHKTMRNRLQSLASRIEAEIGPFGYRVFVDSAPVMEKPLAAKAGLGWQGKHTNLLHKDEGSWFLLGEIYTDLPLPIDTPADDHCGSCRTCLDVCPTRAIVKPYVLDATRCISYLTIENQGPIPQALREPIGNRIFGCDDCQLYCPWNKFSRLTAEGDFGPRHNLQDTELATLFLWDESEWRERTTGSALRRAGYTGWLRNVAVALGNAPTSARIIDALRARAEHSSDLVREHVRWALARHGQ